jgi:hypothetical protein
MFLKHLVIYDVIVGLVSASLFQHDFKIYYDENKREITMTCKVLPGQYFSVGFGIDMYGAGAVMFQGKGQYGEV